MNEHAKPHPARSLTGRYRILFLGLGLWLASGLLPAQAQNISLNPDRPDVYVVERGDTLWDIAGEFLEQPWQWPEVWRANPDIENPDLIYPGDRLRLVMQDGQPRIVLDRDTDRPVVRLSPQMRSQPRDEAIPVMSRDLIDHFLVDNLVIDPQDYERAPYILGSAADNLVISSGDTVLARASGDGWQDTVRQLDIIRMGERYEDPESGELLGHQGLRIGQARRQQGSSGDSEGVRRLEILRSREEIKPGDRLMVPARNAVSTQYMPRPARSGLQGRVLELLTELSLAAQYDSLLISLGDEDGLREGDLLTVHADDQSVTDPLTGDVLVAAGEPVGTLLVYRVFDRLGHGLILEGTAPVSEGFRVTAPQ
ncbi:MAG: LysM domain-containing protein [Pseudohongiellaceae bacterium]